MRAAEDENPFSVAVVVDVLDGRSRRRFANVTFSDFAREVLTRREVLVTFGPSLRAFDPAEVVVLDRLEAIRLKRHLREHDHDGVSHVARRRFGELNAFRLEEPRSPRCDQRLDLEPDRKVQIRDRHRRRPSRKSAAGHD